MGAIAVRSVGVRSALVASRSMSGDPIDPRIARLFTEGPIATPFVPLKGGTFLMGSDRGAQALGWYIDDVELRVE